MAVQLVLAMMAVQLVLRDTKVGSAVEAKIDSAIFNLNRKRLEKVRVENRTEVVNRGGDDVNAEYFPDEVSQDSAPFDPNHLATEFTSKESDEFVRFFNDVNSEGPESGWMMRREEVINSDGSLMSAAEIKDKFAIPNMPNKMVVLTAPAGTRMIVGKANPIEKYGTGGGEQYFSRDWVTSEWYDTSSIIEID